MSDDTKRDVWHLMPTGETREGVVMWELSLNQTRIITSKSYPQLFGAVLLLIDDEDVYQEADDCVVIFACSGRYMKRRNAEQQEELKKR